MNSKLHKFIYITLIILGAAGIIDTLSLALSAGGINLGTLFPGIVGVFLVLISIIKLFYMPGSHIIRKVWIRKTILALFIIWLISFLTIEGLIIYNGRPQRDKPADYLIILGAGLRGEEMSLTLKERMRNGLAYLISNSNMKVIVSGGQGTGEKISEAEAMKRFLIANGIEEDRILKEDRSSNTMQNFKYSRRIILDNGGSPDSTILIGTNDFHMLRAKMLANRNGFTAYALPCRTPPQVLINCYVREYFAVIKSYFLDR